jgi:hypothetical protein
MEESAPRIDFSDAKISDAIDTSGSTAGAFLKTE